MDDLVVVERLVRGLVAAVAVGAPDRPVRVSEVSADTSLGPPGLDLDSLAVAELAGRLEEEFGMAIPDEDLDRFAVGTVADVVRYVAETAAPAWS